jgi:hypothetical protein
MTAGAVEPSFDWNAVSAIAAAVAAIAAAIAAWLSAKQVKAAKDAIKLQADAVQFQIFEDIVRDIQQQEQQFFEAKNPTPEDKAHRDRMFFNAINHLAFLLDGKLLQKAEFLEYYRDAFLYWWTLFEKEVPDLERNDPTKYEEFKRIVAGIRNPPPAFALVK